jgi:hypothetical protein
MSMFKNLATDTSIESDKDTLGGSKFAAWDSGVYDAVIDLAYVDESKGGAMGVNFTFKTQEGKELRQTIYVTSGKEKGQRNYYETKDGTKKYLPGFTLVNDLCLLTVGEELSDLETETKVLSIYSFDAKKEVPTKKEVLTDLLGKDITLGVLKVIEDKYNSPGETRTVNDIAKVFRTEDKMTANEIRAEETEATFYDAWKEKNTGITINKAGKGNKADAPFSTGAEDKPKKSLFSK